MFSYCINIFGFFQHSRFSSSPFLVLELEQLCVDLFHLQNKLLFCGCVRWHQEHERLPECEWFVCHVWTVCIVVSQEEKIILNRKKKLKSSGSRDFNLGFEFGERDVLNDDGDWLMADVLKQLKNKVGPGAKHVGWRLENVQTQICFHVISNCIITHTDSFLLLILLSKL